MSKKGKGHDKVETQEEAEQQVDDKVKWALIAGTLQSVHGLPRNVRSVVVILFVAAICTCMVVVAIRAHGTIHTPWGPLTL